MELVCSKGGGCSLKGFEVVCRKGTAGNFFEKELEVVCREGGGGGV